MKHRGAKVILYPYIDLRGEAVKRLSPQERWVWIGIRLLTADSPYRPMLCVAPDVPFTDEQIAAHLHVSTSMWKNAKKKLADMGYIRIDKVRYITVPEWKEVAGRKYRKHRAEWEKSPPSPEEIEKTVNERRKLMVLYSEITGGVWDPNSKPFTHLVSTRMAEGATPEQLETAIRTYVNIVREYTPGATQMMSPIAPLGGKLFWRLVKINYPAYARGETTREYIARLPPEHRAYARDCAVHYSERLNKYIRMNGIRDYFDLDWKRTPTCKEYIAKKINERRSKDAEF